MGQIAVQTNQTSELNAPPLIAGESLSAYVADVNQLVESTESNSPLVRFFCEQLIEAVYWCRRHQRDKRLFIARSMAGFLSDYPFSKDLELDWQLAIEGQGTEEQLQSLNARLLEKGHTLDGLHAHAVANRNKLIESIERLIDRQLKTIRQFHRCIDEVVAKPLIMKRLKLQIEQLERDGNAIEHV